jgi:TetR/AcrR family fatty acid metabolism transcriptional regulator
MPSMAASRSWKERQRQEREALILQAAEEVLCEKGYHETSIEEIAARVGIAKGTVYLHFPSKEDLVMALVEREARQLQQAIEETIASAMTAREKLEAILRLLYGKLFHKQMRLFYSMYHSPEMRALIARKEQMHERWEQLYRSIGELLEEGKARGEFDAALPTSVMQSLFLNLISVRGYERLVVQEGMALEEVVDYLGRIYFRGIAANQRRDSGEE